MARQSSKLRALHLRQIERRVARYQHLRTEGLPRGGWIRAIRMALGMTSSQLGRRLGVSQGTATSLEQRESEGTATLASVRRAAEALDCDLVYVLLPRTNLSEARAVQAKVAAEAMVRTVDHSMHLEAQRVDPHGTTPLVVEMADDLLRGWSSRIWDLPDGAP